MTDNSDNDENFLIFSDTKQRKKKVESNEIQKTNEQDIPVSTSQTLNSKDDDGDIQYLNNFKKLGINEWLIKNCTHLGITKPTPVQCRCIPQILKGANVLATSQTGTGKTAAFALPILQDLFLDPYGIFCLVLSPTRELALQISDQFQAFGSTMGLRVCLLIGGTNTTYQINDIISIPHIIIATPGRLLAHLNSGYPPNLSKLKYLVLDEVDRLLDPTLELDKILTYLPSSYHWLLFTATLTTGVEEFVKTMVPDIYYYESTKAITTVDQLIQDYLFIPDQIKMCYFIYCIIHYGPHINDDVGSEDINSLIVFTSTVQSCQFIHELLLSLDIESVVLHSVLDQKRRLASLGKFKSGLSKILICTDVASRGLDIPEVDFIINYDLPRNPKDYIHRVGRTARAGKKGKSLSLITQYDVELLLDIEKYIGKKLSSNYKINENNVLLLLNKVNKAEQLAKFHMNQIGFYDRYQNWKKRKLETKQKLRERKKMRTE